LVVSARLKQFVGGWDLATVQRDEGKASQGVSPSRPHVQRLLVEFLGLAVRSIFERAIPAGD